MPKDFLSLADWSPQELRGMLARARELKNLLREGQRPQTLEARCIALFFEKPSLRTHVTFEAGVTQLGGHAIWLRPDQVGVGTRETPADVAANLSRWLDGIVARTYRHALLEEFAEAAEIPVINALTDLLHPCQVMADFQTVAEYGPLESATLAYVGDGNNMANSLMLGAAVLGLTLRLGTPESHRPPASLRERARLLSEKSGARISWSEDPSEAVRAADFVYTDVWASMGQEGERESRRAIFQPYQLNADLMRGAPDARVMHCLPAHRGEEITDEVLDGSRSIVFEQAENRLHAQKAILEHLLLRKA